jgi:hypothetical protein
VLSRTPLQVTMISFCNFLAPDPCLVARMIRPRMYRNMFAEKNTVRRVTEPTDFACFARQADPAGQVHVVRSSRQGQQA